MLDTDRAAYEAEAQQLRLALKAWETAWAREHDGSKPSRDDIRGNAIAKQYTAYNRVRGILAGKTAPPGKESSREARSHQQQQPQQQQKNRPKRKPDADPAPSSTTTTTTSLETPSKRRAVSHHGTPTAAATAAIETPAISRKLFSPVVPTSIGPTPQRDGRVLGLFDVLAEEQDTQERRRRQQQQQQQQQGIDATPSRRDPTAPLGTTPRKQTVDVAKYPSSDIDESDNDDSNALANIRRLGRTPMSAGRRNLLNHFTAPPPKPPAFTPKGRSGGVGGGGGGGSVGRSGGGSGALGTTPLKARNANAQNAQASSAGATGLFATPSKNRSAPVEFATPAFLRRQTFTAAEPAAAAVDENGDAVIDESAYFSPPSKLRLPRKPLVRGLSSVLASLRKAEDDRLDEELAILQELEGEADGASSNKAAEPADVVKDSQVDLEQQQLEEMEALLADSNEGEAQGGGKRLLGGFDDEGMYDSEPDEQAMDRGQPLRVYKKKGQKRTTRLVNMRPTRTKRAVAPVEKDEEEDEGDDTEDVVPETQARASGDEGGADEPYEPDWSDDEGAAKPKATKPKAKKPTGKTTKTTEKTTDDNTKEGTVKKTARKVNELAHANFKRLKLKNTGTKGGPRFNSKFRRRR